MTIEPQRRVFIKTYGCQMNVYDSRRMADALAPLGYGEAMAPEDADLVILNTCHIREKAAEKVYSELGKLRNLKAKRQLTIAVAGCVAQAEGWEIVRRAPAVDLVFGPQAYHRLPQLLARHRMEGRAIVETEFPAEDKFDRLARPTPAKTLARGVTAFLTVQEGCDRFCSFCVVPYTRGAEFSRPVVQIEAEARAYADAGVKELTLLGQNVNAWHGRAAGGESWGLGRLLMHLSRIDGIERLRYATSHPRDMDDDLIEAHSASPEVMPYLHLPVQSGSDRILKAMNRGHLARDYLDVVARVRRARPDIALSGDFIVGFPGETEDDFEATLALVRDVGYAGSFSFKYSPRPGTPAAGSQAQISEAVKSERLARLQAALEEQRQAFNRSCLGRTLKVLLEKPGRREGQIIGRSPYLQSVHLEAASRRMGETVEAVIDHVGPNSLSAHIDEGHR